MDNIRKPVLERDVAEHTSEYVEEQSKLRSSHTGSPFPSNSPLLHAPGESLVTWGSPVEDYPHPRHSGNSRIVVGS